MRAGHRHRSVGVRGAGRVFYIQIFHENTITIHDAYLFSTSEARFTEVNTCFLCFVFFLYTQW